MTDLRLFDIQYRRDDTDPQYAWEIHNWARIHKDSKNPLRELLI